jgi:glucosamine 6-phosphate synthetase-like amidotransferase/phosphosugar isomerase protein
MKKLAAQLKDASDLIFFGRGYNYSTALEAALKVREQAGCLAAGPQPAGAALGAG